MKQLIKVLCAAGVLFLAGCAEMRGSYQDELNHRIERAITSGALHPNYSHGIYSFYKEPSVGRVSSDEISNTFRYDGVRFVMNLKVSSIISSKFYDGLSAHTVPDSLEPEASTEGTLIDYEGNEHPYFISLFRLGEDIYTYAETDQVEFFSISSPLQALQIAETMMRMARTVHVDNDAVIAAYSGRQTIEYSRKRLELFHNIVPENGVIDELFEGNGNYAGQYGGEYYGDNYGQTDESFGDLDFSQGDADDNIGGEIKDVDRNEEIPTEGNIQDDNIESIENGDAGEAAEAGEQVEQPAEQRG